MGVLLGGRFRDAPFALVGEGAFDILNPDAIPGADDRTVIELELSFDPLLIGDVGTGTMFIGPKVGLWGGRQSSDGGTTLAGGLSVGGIAGAFVRANPSMAVGLLTSMVWRKVNGLCASAPGEPQVCASRSNIDSDKVASVAVALLF